MKKIVLAFGRMNPPTVGHEKLVQKIKSVARKEKATPALYLSHTQDKKKNPLSYDDKVRYAIKAFGKIVKKTNARTIIEVLKELDRQYDEVIVVGGSDRVDEFKNLLTKYNGKDYAYEKLDVVSAGERDPDADDVSGMSASKLRNLAATGQVKDFRAGIPAKLRQSKDGAEMYNKIREAMGITEDMTLDEVLNMQQRLKRRALMRRMKGRIKLARRKAKFRMANLTKLKVRAKRKARELIRARVAGAQGKSYKSLPFASRQMIDKKVAKKAALIDRISKKLLPKVRKGEQQRLASVRSAKREDIEYLNLVGEILNEVHSELITEKIEKNLIKKSQKYGVDIQEMKRRYLQFRQFKNENDSFNSLNSELANEAMSPESKKANNRIIKNYLKKKDAAATQREREVRLKAKGWVRNDRGGWSKKDDPRPAKSQQTLDREKRLKAKGWVRNDRGGFSKITEDDKPNKRGDDAKGHKRPTEDGAGLTRKGAKAAGVKTAVTTPPSKLDPDGKAAKRRKSFCARMGGMKGPMKDEKGRPTRKAMSLRRWNC